MSAVSNIAVALGIKLKDLWAQIGDQFDGSGKHYFALLTYCYFQAAVENVNSNVKDAVKSFMAKVTKLDSNQFMVANAKKVFPLQLHGVLKAAW